MNEKKEFICYVCGCSLEVEEDRSGLLMAKPCKRCKKEWEKIISKLKTALNESNYDYDYIN